VSWRNLPDRPHLPPSGGKQVGLTPKDSDRMLGQLVRNIPNGSINVFDRDLRYLYADAQGLEQAGLSPERLVNKTLAEIFPAESVEYVTPYYRRAFSEETVAFELNVAGHVYSINAAPLYDEGNRIYAVIAVAQNITERKRAEEALSARDQLLRTVVLL
jgi:PAS domain S-box-containing protein